MTTLLDNLTSRHPYHLKNSSYWQRLSNFAAGGNAVTAKDKRDILIIPDKRREDSEIIKKRLEIMPVPSLLGSVLIRLQSHIFQDSPTFTSNGADKYWETFRLQGGRTKQGKCSFEYLLARACLNLLIQGSAIAQVDVPATPNARNLAEQTAMGGREPYCFLWQRENLWDWGVSKGELTFTKTHQFSYRKESWDSTPIPVHTLQIFQRKPDGTIISSIYEVVPKEPEHYKAQAFDLMQVPESQVEITTVAEETEIFHVTQNGKKIFKFPIEILTLEGENEVLWMGNQLFSLYKAYINARTSTEWGLLTTNYSQLILQSDKPDEAELGSTGDGHYWVLGEKERAYWLEREGKSLALGIEYSDRCKQEIIEATARVSAAAAMTLAYSQRQSGESKKEDRRIEERLAKSYGVLLREFAKGILDTAAIARGEITDWVVRGLQKFDSDSFLTDLKQFREGSATVGSATLDKEGKKTIASMLLTELGLSQESLATICNEIDTDTQKAASDKIKISTI
ncbi:MAG: hypothetical protein J7647_32110 [Cyanobacteria bacterium SBLK]|nr:hypothetical protein [Cyanobacteria bacterium SBLK]